VTIALAILATIAVTASTGLVYYGLYRGLGDSWQRYPPAARRRGAIAGAIVFVLIVVGTAALIELDPAG
jgi:hypothetical protein